MAAHRLTFPWRTAAAAAAVGLTIIVAHLPSFLHRVLDGDEGIYGSIAALMNMGGGLYDAGGVDNKPPGIFWVYSLTFRIFGPYQMTAVHALALLVVAATCAVLFVVARDLAGTRAGLLAALFYGLLTAAGNPRLLAANTEIFMMLPLCASVLLLLRRRWLWAGILLVAAGAFRQPAAVNVLLAGVAVFWLEASAKDRWAAGLRLAAGLTAGLAAGAILIALSGSLAGFWRWTIATLVGYASTSWAPAYVWSRAKDSVVPFVVDMAVLWIAAVAVASRWRDLQPRPRLIVVWLVLGVVGAVAGGHLSWHYFIQAMGPLAVLAAYAFERFELRRAIAVGAALGIAIPAIAWWAFDLSADPLTYDFSPPVPRHQAVASYIATHTSPSDRIFVWGDWAALYPESNRLMSGRFPGFLRGFERGSDAAPNNWDVAPDVWPLLQSDLAAHPPALVVDTSAANWSDFARYPMGDYPVLADLVASRYHRLATVDGVVFYVRNGS